MPWGEVSENVHVTIGKVSRTQNEISFSTHSVYEKELPYFATVNLLLLRKIKVKRLKYK